MDEQFSYLFNKKPKESYSDDLIYIINIISGNKKDSSVFGSASYPQIRYPSDVDIIETHTGCCDYYKFIDNTVKLIQKVVKNVRKEKYIFFSEFKVGIDDAYFFPILFLYEENVDMAEYNILKKIINEALKIKLFNNTEVEEIYTLMKQCLSKDTKVKYNSIENLFDLFRSKYILRWSVDEILAGVKKLPANRIISLHEALITYATKVKIDTFAPINAKYIEATNIFDIKIKNKNKEYQISIARDEAIESLQIDICKMLYVDKFYNPFKAIKRMFSLAKQYKDVNMLNKLIPLLNSDAAILYQIKSEIDVIILMLERLKQIPKISIDLLKNQIDNFKMRLAYIYKIDYDSNKVYNLINKILKNFKLVNKKKLIEMFNEIINIFNEEIIEYTAEYILKNGLTPIPKNYLCDTKFIISYYPCKNIGNPLKNNGKIECFDV